MYVQIIKSIDDDRDMIELVEDLNSYGVNISVKPSSILNKFNKGSMLIDNSIRGDVKINLTVKDARQLIVDLTQAIEKASGKTE